MKFYRNWSANTWRRSGNWLAKVGQFQEITEGKYIGGILEITAIRNSHFSISSAPNSRTLEALCLTVGKRKLSQRFASK